MNVVSENIDALVHRLSQLTGEDVETALERALQERLSRIAVETSSDRQAALVKFFGDVSVMPLKDPRSIDELLGYGADGLPN